MFIMLSKWAANRKHANVQAEMQKIQLVDTLNALTA